MKTIIYLFAGILSLQAQAGGSDVNSGGISKIKTLECFIASNPQDALISQLTEDGQTLKSEKALLLRLDVNLFEESDSKFHAIKAETASLLFDTSAGLVKTKQGRKAIIDCDGGSWDVKLLNNGNMVISNVFAIGNIKDAAYPEGCGGPGSISATTPINLVKVTCRK